MTILIDYWDVETQSQKQREATPQEISQRLLDIAEATKPVIPQSVTPRQAKLSLAMGGVYDEIIAILEGLPEPQKTLSKIEWDYATEFKRSHMLVHQMKQAMGWTDEFVDELFINAATL